RALPSPRTEFIGVLRRDRSRLRAASEVVGRRIGIGGEELHLAPLAPVAFMAPVRLPIRQLLTEAFDSVPEPPLGNAYRTARRPLHSAGLRGGANSSTAGSAAFGTRGGAQVFHRRAARHPASGQSPGVSVSVRARPAGRPARSGADPRARDPAGVDRR